MGMKRWAVGASHPGEETELSKQLQLGKLAASALFSRGISSAEQAREFLNGGQPLSDPFLLKDMNLAVQRIKQAIEAGERIAVYGDYDCDGVTSTVLLFTYLEAVGADVLRYIPSREQEGYGLNYGAIDRLLEEEVTLIITVDNGVSALDEIDYASQKGIDVVVTDHHQPREELPRAVAVVDPHRADCPSPCKNLAGVGVAFKLVCALEDGDIEGCLEQFSDLAAVGTIADVVELTGENRTLVRYGLQKLSARENLGLTMLLEQSGIGEKTVSSQTVAFGLAPRINAAGRLGDTEDAVRLLLSEEEEEARALALRVDENNAERKRLEQDILNDIAHLLSQNPRLLYERVLILVGKGWHAGVIGIVASRMVERFGKPCIIISDCGEELRGSGRSVEGFSLVQAIAACGEYLTRFGGHVMAAGFSLLPEQLDGFLKAFSAYVRKHFDEMPLCSLRVDAIIQPVDLSLENVRQLSLLEPFGCGNEQPVFGLRSLTVEGIYPIGNNRHLRLKLKQGDVSFFALYFGVTAEDFPFQVGQIVEIAATLEQNVYNNTESVSVKIKDLRAGALDEEKYHHAQQRYEKLRRGELAHEQRAQLLPSREELAAVYRCLRGAGENGLDCDGLYFKLGTQNTDFGRMRVAMDVFEELGLIEYEGRRAHVWLQAPKADLERSKILAYIKG